MPVFGGEMFPAFVEERNTACAIRIDASCDLRCGDDRWKTAKTLQRDDKKLLAALKKSAERRILVLPLRCLHMRDRRGCVMLEIVYCRSSARRLPKASDFCQTFMWERATR